MAAISLHALRIFFTGAFRKPREINWVIGTVLFALAAFEDFAGYSLPDDLLSGSGLRIADGIMLSVPVVGTYLSFFVFGGQYPGDIFISRLYIAHVLIISGLLLALITAHLMILWHQGHTRWPGKKERDRNEVGEPLYPVFMAKTAALFFFVFGVLAVFGALAQINPIWLFGPYNPAISSNTSQPDWYIGFLEGALRLMPLWKTDSAGHTIMWNIFIPGVVLVIAFFLIMGGYPFFEQWATGDIRPHQVLDRPRNMPPKTAIGAAIVAMAADLQLAGSDDVIAFHLIMPVEDLVWAFRAGFFVLPAVAFVLTRRACIALQRRDRRRLREGTEFDITAVRDGAAYAAVAPSGRRRGAGRHGGTAARRAVHADPEEPGAAADPAPGARPAAGQGQPFLRPVPARNAECRSPARNGRSRPARQARAASGAITHPGPTARSPRASGGEKGLSGDAVR